MSLHHFIHFLITFNIFCTLENRNLTYVDGATVQGTLEAPMLAILANLSVGKWQQVETTIGSTRIAER